ncbi:antibiotic biosynthesis monooxygenase [Rhodococcus sp. D2-41]|uniref:Antibiotic biosynthesis monooxygenase n=1 Tax=Speluncibacter jeojiensis TaxID=2710754 RepID=A0A9X4M7R6_9ACTN|nr:putative quinol monooxygenase [Rhodococcus sp. D2-41]MDG3009599.1 antibiotic biosynthesis monooxygenase [Rhodococcus sp. D2-41]MDG3016803.1 antibiotic biosynthesis monooxygenase [Corynebacteriales bacterium D3-21]
MIGVIATMTVQDGNGPQFEAVAAELIEKVRAQEDGNLLYQLTRSKADANVYKFMELYRDADALRAHGTSDYFRESFGKLGALLAGEPQIEYLDGV